MPDHREFRSALNRALDGAGRILLRHFGRISIRYKGRADLLTQADLQSQSFIVGFLEKRFPSHGIVAEEKHRRREDAEFLWVIDPLDGTTNYAHGYPAACVSIALLRRGSPVLAGIYDPFRDERFTAERGRGCRLNGRATRVSRPRELSESLLLTGFAYDRAERSRFYIEFYRRFMVRSHDVRRSGSAALDMAWIASGRADGYWEFSLNPWDVAAGLLLVEEAGGRVSDFSGKSWGSDWRRFGRETLATNGLLHASMLRILRSGAGK